MKNLTSSFVIEKYMMFFNFYDAGCRISFRFSTLYSVFTPDMLCKALKSLLVSAYFFIEKCFKSTESNSKKFNLFVVLCSLQSISLGRCALSCTRHQFFHTPFFLNLFLCQACMYHYQYALYMQHDCILMILYLRRRNTYLSIPYTT